MSHISCVAIVNGRSANNTIMLFHELQFQASKAARTVTEIRHGSYGSITEAIVNVHYSVKPNKIVRYFPTCSNGISESSQILQRTHKLTQAEMNLKS